MAQSVRKPRFYPASPTGRFGPRSYPCVDHGTSERADFKTSAYRKILQTCLIVEPCQVIAILKSILVKPLLGCFSGRCVMYNQGIGYTGPWMVN